MLVLQAEGSSDVVLPTLLKGNYILVKFSLFFFRAETPAKYGHVASTTPPFNAPTSPAEPHRKWGLLALYIAHNPHLTLPYVPQGQALYRDPCGLLLQCRGWVRPTRRLPGGGAVRPELSLVSVRYVCGI